LSPSPTEAIGHESPVKLGLVLAMLAAAGIAATTYFRVEQSETKLETATRSNHSQELRLQALEKDYAAISKALDRIDAKLDQLLVPVAPRRPR